MGWTELLRKLLLLGRMVWGDRGLPLQVTVLVGLFRTVILTVPFPRMTRVFDRPLVESPRPAEISDLPQTLTTQYGLSREGMARTPYFGATTNPSRWMGRLAPSLTLVTWALQLLWQSARGWTLAWLGLVVMQGLLPVATVYLTRDLVNLLVAVNQGGLGADKPQTVAPTMGVLALVLVLGQALQGMMDWVRTNQSDLVQDHLMNLIHPPAHRLSLGCYGDPQDYDYLERSPHGAVSRPISLLENLSSLLQNSLTLVAMAAILVPFGAWVPLTLVLSTLPAFGFTLYYQRHSWQMGMTRQQRRGHHYEYLLTSRDNSPEIGMFNLSPYFRPIYQRQRQRQRQRRRQERLGMIRQQTLANLGSRVLAIAVTGGVMGVMIWRALQGQVSLGDLALIHQALNQGLGLMRTLLNRADPLYFNSLFIQNLGKPWWPGRSHKRWWAWSTRAGGASLRGPYPRR